MNPLKSTLACLALLASNMILPAQEAAPPTLQSVRLFVQAEPHQTLQGFGCSQIRNDLLPEAVRTQLFDRCLW